MTLPRLPYDAVTEQEVRQYFITRALQMAPYDIVWLGDLSQPKEGCFLTHFYDITFNQRYVSFYVTAPHRGKGLAVRAVKYASEPIITVSDCGIVDFLVNVGADFRLVTGVFDSIAYELIQHEYGDQRAKRSQVLLMNHIDEGLYVLAKIGASEDAKRAYCLHPLVQNDQDLAKNFDAVTKAMEFDPRQLMLALEYRNIANNWLSDKVWFENGLNPHMTWAKPPVLSPLKEVNDMLIADKIQNYKDFITYHKGKHPRSDELDTYFQVWLRALRVDNFQWWFDNLSSIVPKRFT